MGRGIALRRASGGPLLQLPALLPRGRIHALGAGFARVRRLPRHAAVLRGRCRAEDAGVRALHADFGQRHDLPDADGARGVRPEETVPARRLGRGRAADHAADHRRDGRARDLRGLWAVRSVAQRRDERLARPRGVAGGGAGKAAGRRGSTHPGGRDPGARLERDARLLQQP